MKLISKSFIWVLFFALMVGNIYVFVSGITLSDQIHDFEQNISALRLENTELETKVFRMESITYAASVAADLDYTAKSEPVFFGAQKVAYNQ